MVRHKHLARLEKVWRDSLVFYLTVCTIDRRQTLASHAMHAICREVWSNCEANYGWRVGRYVLMPDHAHFFCWPCGNVAGVTDPGSATNPTASVSDPGPTRSNEPSAAGLVDPGYSKALEFKEPASLSTFVGKWKEWTSKYAHRRHGVNVPLWQPEFFDHLLRSWESYENKWNYVRENPLRANLVSNVNDWPYQGEIHKLL